MMDQYEPSRLLENIQSGLDGESVQQYVEIGENKYVGTKDGIKYTLISVADNKFKLCEVSANSNMSLSSSKSSWCNSSMEDNRNSSWCDSSIENNRNNTSFTPTSDYKNIKLITVRRDLDSCKGQGDGSENTFISTPDSDPRFKSVNISIPEIGGEQKNPIEKIQTLTYTTLLPKQDNVDKQATVSYSVASDSYYQVIPQVQETPHRPGRVGRPRMSLLANPSFLNCSPIEKPAKRGRGRGRGRGRKPRQVWYQCKTPVMHSTPASSTGLSYNASGSSFSAMDGAKSLSLSSCNESQASLQYPRVPNNTPTSEGELAGGGRQKMLDMQQWIPQLQSRLEGNYVQMDPRECHNEKERKRRLRIKNACQSMKSHLPCVSEKTDNATVFENAVNFISFVKETIGNDYDMVRNPAKPEVGNLRLTIRTWLF